MTSEKYVMRLTSLLKFLTLNLIWALSAHRQSFQTFPILLCLTASLLFPPPQASTLSLTSFSQRKFGHWKSISTASHDIYFQSPLGSAPTYSAVLAVTMGGCLYPYLSHRVPSSLSYSRMFSRNSPLPL